MGCFKTCSESTTGNQIHTSEMSLSHPVLSKSANNRPTRLPHPLISDANRDRLAGAMSSLLILYFKINILMLVHSVKENPHPQTNSRAPKWFLTNAWTKVSGSCFFLDPENTSTCFFFTVLGLSFRKWRLRISLQRVWPMGRRTQGMGPKPQEISGADRGLLLKW